MWEVSQFSSLRMGLGFRSTVLLVLTHCDLTQVSEVFYISAAQPKNMLFLLTFVCKLSLLQLKGQKYLKNNKKFLNLVLKTLSSFSKLHFPVLLLFCNVFLCCTLENFIWERIVSLPYFTIKANIL